VARGVRKQTVHNPSLSSNTFLIELIIFPHLTQLATILTSSLTILTNLPLESRMLYLDMIGIGVSNYVRKRNKDSWEKIPDPSQSETIPTFQLHMQAVLWYRTCSHPLLTWSQEHISGSLHQLPYT
jgi:hypothetical protein